MTNEVNESPKDFFDTFEAGFLVGIAFSVLTLAVSVYLYYDFLQFTRRSRSVSVFKIFT